MDLFRHPLVHLQLHLFSLVCCSVPGVDSLRFDVVHRSHHYERITMNARSSPETYSTTIFQLQSLKVGIDFRRNLWPPLPSVRSIALNAVGLKGDSPLPASFQLTKTRTRLARLQS